MQSYFSIAPSQFSTSLVWQETWKNSFSISGIPSSKLIWTSYRDEEEEGVFVDQFGNTLEWDNWGLAPSGRQEPDRGREENCLAVSGKDFLWHDVSCEGRKRLPFCIYK